MTFKPAVGKVRRSQGVFTYGIGAIVDLKNGSFMPLGTKHMDYQWRGLDAEAKEAITIREPRLQKLLGVRGFRTLPAPSDRELGQFDARVKQHWSAPCVRFPRWLECPHCNRLSQVAQPFELQPDGQVRCQACDRHVNPVRFVVACKRGHINDFPWLHWAHSQPGIDICNQPQLRLVSDGQSAALSDLRVRCETCDNSRDLGDIFRAGPGISCSGSRPWMLDREETCDEPLRTLQRGATNVHFPIPASMLSIPPASDALAKILERQMHWINAVPQAALRSTVEGWLRNEEPDLDPEDVIRWIEQRSEIDADGPPHDEQSARQQEFEALCTDCPPVIVGGAQPDFECERQEVPQDLIPWIDTISAVHRLREVRACCGFSRVDPWPASLDNLSEARNAGQVAPLADQPPDWYPATEVRGEGIFVRLSESRVAAWERDPGLQIRAAAMHRILADSLHERGYEPTHRVSPRLLLVHSLAHILIRRLSLDCGYSSASLRERLYVAETDSESPPMAGLLIYTASADSDGSLGGLAALAHPDRIRHVLGRSLQDAEWCANDPVCVESEIATQGDRVSGASCHSCLIVSETSCERFNKELDRVVLIGTNEPQDLPGYFCDLLKTITG